MSDLIEPYAELFPRNVSTTGSFDTPIYRKLPEGVNTLMVTWTGEKLASVLIRRGGFGNVTKNIQTIPAGSGTRMITVPGVHVSPGEVVEVAMGTTLDQPLGHTATVTVINTPLKSVGGGSFFGAARRLVAGWAK